MVILVVYLGSLNARRFGVEAYVRIFIKCDGTALLYHGTSRHYKCIFKI
jgi:hypothetical protein